MKKMIALSALLIATNTFASTFECKWLNEGITEGNQFYRPASFVMDINQSSVKVSQDSFFDREYKPCWTGSFESCRFAFELPQKALPIVDKSSKQISLEFESLDEYGVGSLFLDFDKEVSKVTKGDAVRMIMSGDDGDGTFLNESVFSCKRLR